MVAEYLLLRCLVGLLLQERLELESLLQSLVAQDPTSCYAQLRAAVLRCNKIRNIPGTHQQMALENQVCVCVCVFFPDAVDVVVCRFLYLEPQPLATDM